MYFLSVPLWSIIRWPLPVKPLRVYPLIICTLGNLFWLYINQNICYGHYWNNTQQPYVLLHLLTTFYNIHNNIKIEWSLHKLYSMSDGSWQGHVSHVRGNEIETKIVWPCLVGGRNRKKCRKKIKSYSKFKAFPCKLHYSEQAFLGGLGHRKPIYDLPCA